MNGSVDGNDVVITQSSSQVAAEETTYLVILLLRLDNLGLAFLVVLEHVLDHRVRFLHLIRQEEGRPMTSSRYELTGRPRA